MTIAKKSATTKVVIPTTIAKKSFFKQKVTLVLDHTSIPTGTYFTATINGKKSVQGLIYNDKKHKRLYFCQNTFNYDTSPDSLGYDYSYSVSYNSQPEETSYLKELSFPTPPKDFQAPKSFKTKINGSFPSIRKGGIKVGCTTVPNSVIRALVKELID